MSASTKEPADDRRRRPRPQRRRGRVPLAAAALALAAAAGAASGAGSRQLAVRHFTAADGLVQADVQALLRDPTGYLWVGTRDGLSRFDGRRFSTVPFPAGASGTFVTVLAFLPGGTLVGSASGEVSRWDGAKLVAPWPETALSRAPVRAFAPSADGGVLVGTDRGLWRCTGGGCVLVSDAAVRDIVPAGGEGSSWIITSEGASLLTPAASRPADLAGCGPPCAVAAAAGGPDGSLYLLPAGGGLLTMAGDGVRRRDLDVAGPTSLAVAADGTVWVGTRRGLFSWTGKDGLSRCILRYGEGVDVAALLVDHEGSLWVGTRGEGLYQVPPGAFELLTGASGLPAPTVRAMAAGGGGCVWLATEVAGVASRCDGAWGAALTAADGLPGPGGTALLVLDDGSLLVGTGRGLVRWAAGGRARPVDMAAAGVGDAVTALARAPDGGVWVGTKRGVARLAPASLVPQGPLPWPLEGEVAALAAAGSGALWVALEGQGLFRADGAGVRRVGGGTRVAADGVTSLLIDGRGRLWVGTADGILVLAPEGGAALEVPGEAIGGHAALSLAEDASGAVWAGTPRGVARVAPDGTVDRVLTAADGLAGGGAVRGCAVVDGHGRLWLGSTNGVTLVPVTRGAAGAPAPPPLVISSVQAGGGQWASSLPCPRWIRSPPPASSSTGAAAVSSSDSRPSRWRPPDGCGTGGVSWASTGGGAPRRARGPPPTPHWPPAPTGSRWWRAMLPASGPRRLSPSTCG